MEHQVKHFQVREPDPKRSSIAIFPGFFFVCFNLSAPIPLLKHVLTQYTLTLGTHYKGFRDNAVLKELKILLAFYHPILVTGTCARKSGYLSLMVTSSSYSIHGDYVLPAGWFRFDILLLHIS